MSRYFQRENINQLVLSYPIEASYRVQKKSSEDPSPPAFRSEIKDNVFNKTGLTWNDYHIQKEENLGLFYQLHQHQWN